VEPELQAQYEFPTAGKERIACKVQDDMGGAGIWTGLSAWHSGPLREPRWAGILACCAADRNVCPTVLLEFLGNA